MTTEKHDPRALLREAREELNVLASYAEDPAFKWPSLGLKVRAKAQRKMRDRIDSALAAHEAEERVDSATPVVEEEDWEEVTGPWWLRYCSEGMQLDVDQTLAGQWYWRAQVFATEPVTTLDEAKSAAIAAAKGMR